MIITITSGTFTQASRMFYTALTIKPSHGDTAFFVTDTRRYRSDPIATETSARTMLGDRQLSALRSWLSEVRFTHPDRCFVNSRCSTILGQ